MSNLVVHREQSHALVKPEPRSPVTIRLATSDGGRDLRFIDALMKQHTEMVGFASTTELQSHIDDRTALVAEDAATRIVIGYLLYKDRYLKREDCGIVSQLVVSKNRHRGLVGASLVQAMFERQPYGVRLFCLWCAQDLEANCFWEALGFVPLAFRTGARGKEHGGRRKETRLHIFWQRRVRAGDDYPYWFPSQTQGGRMGQPRIVLPIPPGTHWRDAKPAILPEWGARMERLGEANALPEGEREKGIRKPRQKKTRSAAPEPAKPRGGMWFAAPPAPPTPTAPPPPPPTTEELAKIKAEKKAARAKFRNDPKLVAAAREFRDRYLDEVNSADGRMLLASNGKYDVSRQLESAPSWGAAMKASPVAILEAA